MLFTAPLTPVLHPSPWRLRCLGLFTLLGHPLFGWIWGEWLPQPYENYRLRGIMAALGLILMVRGVSHAAASQFAGRAFSAVFWIQLPLFFSWMYLCNSGNTVWLASVCAMILIYYHVTDWRLATLGTMTGGLLAWLLFEGFGPGAAPMTEREQAVNAVVIAFSWSSFCRRAAGSGLNPALRVGAGVGVGHLGRALHDRERLGCGGVPAGS